MTRPYEGDGAESPPPAVSQDPEAAAAVLAVIRELRQSGLTDMEGIIRQAITGSQLAIRSTGSIVESAGRGQALSQMMSEWTFLTEHYVYTGTSGPGSQLW